MNTPYISDPHHRHQLLRYGLQINDGDYISNPYK